MRILIATGIYPPDIGGPAQYARGVENAWKEEGHEVKVHAFRFERKLPTGIRHIYYFFRVLFSIPSVDLVFSPDTFSAAIPALLAGKLLGKKIIIRTGGDFLWEQYVERTGDLVLLKDFYFRFRLNLNSFRLNLNLREKIVFKLLRFLFRHADAIIFSTVWQRDIFAQPYRLDLKRCFVVENYYGAKERVRYSYVPMNVGMKKIFAGGVRDLKWKNIPRVQQAFARVRQKGIHAILELRTGSRKQFLSGIQSSYAVIIASLGDVSPNTILEAIQHGKPFILTRETGLYEKLKDIGVWVVPESVDDIAAKIEWLCDEKNYAAQASKVRAFSFTHSWKEITDEILAVYRHL